MTQGVLSACETGRCGRFERSSYAAPPCSSALATTDLRCSSSKGPPDDQRAPVLRQRRRLQETLATLTDDQWRSASRCAGWSVQDVIAHLIGTNGFWSMSILAGLAGLADPGPRRVRPRDHPGAHGGADAIDEPGGDVRAVQRVGTRRCSTRSSRSTSMAWSTVAESPAGHVPIRLLASHALWGRVDHTSATSSYRSARFR